MEGGCCLVYAVVGREEAITIARPTRLIKDGECCMMKSRLACSKQQGEKKKLV